MKYIITESRLENLIFKYLDDKFNGVELKKGKYCDIVFAFPGEDFGLIAWNSPDELFTLLDLINDIGFMFSMDRSDVLDVIGRYVESRYNLKVNSNRKKRHERVFTVESRYNLKVNSNSTGQIKSVVKLKVDE